MIKILVASLIIIGCGGFGFKLAADFIREERFLRQFIGALDYMECELQYRLTPLPELSRNAAKHCGGCLNKIFLSLASELEEQISPDVERCMCAALSKQKDIPKVTKTMLELFGRSLGRFDLEGQLKGIIDIRTECQRHLNDLSQNKRTRLRSYRTLALCAGAALAILFI